MLGRKSYYAPVIDWSQKRKPKQNKYKKVESKPVPRSRYYNELFYSYFKGWE